MTRPTVPRSRIGTWLARPLASFHLIVTIAILLTVLGLVMVLSASSVEAYATDGSAYSLFTRQVIFAVLGLVLFYIALIMPVRVMRRLSFPAFAISVVLLGLVLVPGIGTMSQGTRGWLVIGPVSLQPSELTKIAFAVWGAHLLASRRGDASLRELIVPLVPAAIVVSVLIVVEPDLGQTVCLGIILLALLWFAGLSLRLFVTIVATALGSVVLLAVTAGYRSDRVRAFLDPGADPQGIGYQSRQARFSLADGGIWGRGLGQSRAKWNYLPNAHNDFIFAIIGEELGFLGGVAVIGLFGLFVYAGLRIAFRSVDPFLRLLTATATTWTVGQAFINIGYVIGLLPVTGLQLPLVSAGGTATATTLLMFGLIANAARHEPEAVAALHAGNDGRFGRLLRLPNPEQYSPSRAGATRSGPARRAGTRRIEARNDKRPPQDTKGGRADSSRQPRGPSDKRVGERGIRR